MLVTLQGKTCKKKEDEVVVTLQGGTLQKEGMGDIPLQGFTLQDAAFTQGYNSFYTFRAPPVKGRLLCRDYP